MINLKALKENFGAHTLIVLFNILFQLVSVPIFLAHWGINLYADWLILVSLASYFAMSDIGLNTVTLNEFTIEYSRQQINKCNVLFNNNLFFISSIFGLVFISSLICFYILDLSHVFRLTYISERLAEFIIFCLIIKIFAGMTSGLFDAIYRATSRNARGVMINNFSRILENTILVLGVLTGVNLSILLILYTLPSIIALFYKVLETHRYFPLSIHPKYYSWQELKRIILPAMSFLSFPVGNSIILQGFTLLVNFTLGSAAVVIYNTTRTLINFIKVGMGLINSSVWPELSLAYGRADTETMRKLHRYSVSVSIYFTIAAGIFLFFFGEYIFIHWTRGEVVFDMKLFNLFLLTLLTNTVWYTSSVVLAATNNHEKFSVYYLVACVISLLFGFIIIHITKQISYLPMAMVCIDLILIYIVFKNSFIVVKDDLKVFILKVMSFPAEIFLNLLKK